MSKKRVFLTVQALLCILIAAVLAVITVRTFIEGSAWQAAGHPSDPIFTREKAGQALMTVLPLFCISAVMTIIGLVKGIKDVETKAVRTEMSIQHTSPEAAKRRILVRRILLAAAIVFVVLGMFNGSMKDVLVKAIKICSECIGLG
ncbi:MAG: hypothetical protein J6D14_00395 [Lachnospiraceae bacterium]|nr:hypothetical protein [Lachnospiraceae bacterium]